MNEAFQDKVVLITGAASGIGRTTALEFGALGAKVVVSDVNEADGIKTAEQIGTHAIFVKADVANWEEVNHLMQKTISHFGRIDIAINNAGIGPKIPARTAQHRIEDWNRVIAVNQTGVFYCMKLELEQMLKQGGGAIVNIASVAGLKALQNNIAYTASKHAVIGMTKTAALEYAKKNIRVNAICPVFTHSPMLESLFATQDGLRERLVHTIPIGRYGESSEIAAAILWLCSDAASFTTGLALPIDGGMLA